MHRHICAVEVLVLEKRLVEVAQIGIHAVHCIDVEHRRVGTAMKRDGTARLDGERLDNDILEREVVFSLGKRVCAEHAQVLVVGIILHTQTAAAAGLYVVAPSGSITNTSSAWG